jgi:dihydroflavonol-4-reductase
MMNILVLGGSGLLGSYTVREAKRRGHATSILSRGSGIASGAAEGADGARWIRGDVSSMTRGELAKAMAGQDAIVYALGLDDRAPIPRPAYETLRADHVDTCLKVLRAAREAGARKAVVFGSYFTYFDELKPELRLAQLHPYVRSRREQREMVAHESGPDFDTALLEIPYVIGSLPGKVPPWAFLFDMLAGGGPLSLFFHKGGTAAVTAHQVAEAAIGALERENGGAAYPLGALNLSWPELASRFWAIRGTRGKRLVGLPEPVFGAFGALSSLFLAFSGKERGLDIRRFARFQYYEAFIDPEPTMKALSFGHDDYGVELERMLREWESIRNSRREPPTPCLRRDSRA